MAMPYIQASTVRGTLENAGETWTVAFSILINFCQYFNCFSRITDNQRYYFNLHAFYTLH
jgi:hypothetical protein